MQQNDIKVLCSHSSFSKLSTYLKSVIPDKNEMLIAPQEDTFVFDTIKPSGFKFVDGTFALVKKWYEPKFTCSSTKMEAIIGFVSYEHNVDFITLKIMCKNSSIHVSCHHKFSHDMSGIFQQSLLLDKI